MSYFLYTLSVLIHIVAASLWVGGTLFLVLVLIPVLRKSAEPSKIAAMVEETGLKFRTYGWICFATLTATGLYNLIYRGIGWTVMTNADFWGSHYGRALALKLGMFATIVAIAAFHDFSIGPKASQSWRNNPDAPETKRLRRLAVRMGMINLLLSLAVIWLATTLPRGWLF